MDYEQMMDMKEKRFEYLHKKAFTRWLNSLLNEDQQVGDLFLESRTSELVKKLSAIVNFENIKLEWESEKTENPSRIHHMIDTEKAIDFLKKNLKIELVNIHPSDIIDGNRTSTLGLIWSTILAYQGFRLRKILDHVVNSENHKFIQEIADRIISRKFDDNSNKKLDILMKLINIAKPNSFELVENGTGETNQNMSTLIKALEISHHALGLPYLLDSGDMEEEVDIDDKLVFILLSEVLVKLHNQELSAKNNTHEALKLLTAIQNKIARIGLNESHDCCQTFVETCQQLRSRLYCSFSDKDQRSEVRLLKRIVEFTEIVLDRLNKNYDSFLSRNINDESIKVLYRTISEDGSLKCICAKVMHYESLLNSFEKSILIHLHSGVTDLENKLSSLRKLISSCEINEIEKVSCIQSLCQCEIKSCCNNRLGKLSSNFKTSMRSLWTYQENLELNIKLTSIINESHDFFSFFENHSANKLSQCLDKATAELDAAQKLNLITCCKSLVELLNSNSLN